jgi:predicted acylesterase/phospholipase RssA
MSTAIPTPALKKCDVVMKGGITSGIVYPGLICKLAERYRFQSIGGTSAGAIAAALTAAAEYARRNGRNTFSLVGEVSDWFGRDCEEASGSNLLNLFQPQREMKVLFRLATALLVKGWLRRSFLLAQALWFEILLGLIPSFALACLVFPSTGWRAVAAVLLGFFAVIAGIGIAGAIGILLRTRRLSSHYYGLCTAWTRQQKGHPPSLIGWLNEQLNKISGAPSDRPLTFGDLKGAGITLKMISTCLTFGRPYTLPFESSEFFYSPSEMRHFFPDEVVRWMEDHPAQLSDHGEPIDTTGFKPLPDHDNLPVIVATRLSLSFPFLFCAVPLYAVDWSRRRREVNEVVPAERVPGDALDPKELRKPEAVWFSDGGICSNFPLHLFDSPLPKWPTFGINLRDARPDRPDHVWMPRSNRSGVAHLWTRLRTNSSIGAAGAFFSVMFDSARNWMDNLQSMVPGYRDRLVHVYLDKLEGGLNLNMPSEIVTALSGYGELAAEKLIDHFLEGKDNGDMTVMTWDNHRWIRYRSTMALVETFLADLSYSVEHPEPSDRTFFELITRHKDEPPTSYALTEMQRNEANEMTQRLRDLGGEVQTLQHDAPRPTAALRVRPSY